jgi:hypothetical protein
VSPIVDEGAPHPIQNLSAIQICANISLQNNSTNLHTIKTRERFVFLALLKQNSIPFFQRQQK